MGECVRCYYHRQSLTIINYWLAELLAKMVLVIEVVLKLAWKVDAVAGVAIKYTIVWEVLD